jgi:hypothetical protein
MNLLKIHLSGILPFGERQGNESETVMTSTLFSKLLLFPSISLSLSLIELFLEKRHEQDT